MGEESKYWECITCGKSGYGFSIHTCCPGLYLDEEGKSTWGNK